MNKKKTASLGMFTRIVGSQGFVSVLSVLIAFAIGAILIAATGGFRHRRLLRDVPWGHRGPAGVDVMRAIKPLTDSVFFGIPLIISGLGLAFGFRAGLFNIGGKGQMIVGALAAVWVGFSMSLPPVVHTFVAVAAAIIAGAAYAGIAGVLKAKTGANEVIVTIMLNSIAVLGLGYVLSQPSWQRPGSNQPVTPNVAETAAFAKFFDGPDQAAQWHHRCACCVGDFLVADGALDARFPDSCRGCESCGGTYGGHLG